MKKFKQLLCIALFFASLSVQASSKVVMNYKGGNTHSPNSRVPVAPIYVNQDDHTFIFSSNLAGEIIEVMGKDGLLYTSIIGEMVRWSFLTVSLVRWNFISIEVIWFILQL